MAKFCVILIVAVLLLGNTGFYALAQNLPTEAVAGSLMVSQSVNGLSLVESPSDHGLNGITFPIPELGKCASRTACRNYCNDPSNLDTCTTFAKVHGLMNEAQAARAEKFVSVLKSEQGPGGCDSPRSCESFCSNTQNLDACVQWATDHNLKNDNLATAQKIQKFLKSGGQLPGGCNSRETCAAYCSDFGHAEECIKIFQ